MEDSAEASTPVETGEFLSDVDFLLQTPQEFRDDFVNAAQHAQARVSLMTMQFEVNDDTKPIFDALAVAEAKGLDVRFVYDRVARRHLRAGDDQAWVLGGKSRLHRGDKIVLKKSNIAREKLISELEDIDVTDVNYGKRFTDKPNSHNHMKLAIVDDTVWFGTMNLRGIDFEWSNFMIRLIDKRWVEAMKNIFDGAAARQTVDDFELLDDPEHAKTSLLVDGGKKKHSVIFEKALEVIDSLEDGDEIVYVGQWPPVKLAFGKFANTLYAKLGSKDTKAKFLISPADKLHPTRWGSHKLQGLMERKARKYANLDVVNLARPTHAKAILINRADGSREVLFGSHNFTRFTVKNGTKELAMWSKDEAITAQLAEFIQTIESET